MSSYIETGVYMRVEEMKGGHAPHPKPLESGFNDDTAYRVIGVYNPSETSEAYLAMINDRQELWYISNRHLRYVGIYVPGKVHETMLSMGRGEAKRYYLPMEE